MLEVLCLSRSRKLPADVDGYCFDRSDIRPDYFPHLVCVSVVEHLFQITTIKIIFTLFW